MQIISDTQVLGFDPLFSSSGTELSISLGKTKLVKVNSSSLSPLKLITSSLLIFSRSLFCQDNASPDSIRTIRGVRKITLY